MRKPVFSVQYSVFSWRAARRCRHGVDNATPSIPAPRPRRSRWFPTPLGTPSSSSDPVPAPITSSPTPQKALCPLCTSCEPSPVHAPCAMQNLNTEYCTLNTLACGHAHKRAAAFTMIEMVAAMGLFIAIFGILLLALNTATNLWQDSRAQSSDLPDAITIADIMADDLYQAVTESGINTNYSSHLPEEPTFMLANHPLTAASSEPTLILGMLRPAQRLPGIATQTEYTRHSLDATLYLVYSNSLFRCSTHLPYISDNSTTIGELFELACNEALLAVQNYNPANLPNVDNEPNITLLASHVVPSLAAIINRDLVDNLTSNFNNELLPGSALAYITFEHFILPDAIDLELLILDPLEWIEYHNLIHDQSSESVHRREQLGTLITRRITLPQAGGSRLP